MVEHTPGPWKVLWNGDAVWSDKSPVCNLAGCLSNPETAKANAHLIAGAPETAAQRDRLLAVNAELILFIKAVLKTADSDGDVLEFLPNSHVFELVWGEDPSPGEAWLSAGQCKRIKAVIAKAEDNL